MMTAAVGNQSGKPIAQHDRGTRNAVFGVYGDSHSLTINYEEQEQANKVSSGTSV
jgi:hypothetical protein